MNYTSAIQQEFLNEITTELQKELELESLNNLFEDVKASITDGASAIYNGTSAIYNGASVIYNGASAIYNGTSAIYNGTSK